MYDAQERLRAVKVDPEMCHTQEWNCEEVCNWRVNSLRFCNCSKGFINLGCISFGLPFLQKLSDLRLLFIIGRRALRICRKPKPFPSRLTNVKVEGRILLPIRKPGPHPCVVPWIPRLPTYNAEFTGRGGLQGNKAHQRDDCGHQHDDKGSS